MELLADRVDDLVSWQEKNGLFAYPVHPNGNYLEEDLSCTLYAALAFRAAESVGVEVPDRAFKALAKGTLDCLTRTQTMTGLDGSAQDAAGFSYRRGGGATASMTTAGLSVLAICSERMGISLPKGIRNEMEGARTQGLAWMDAKMKWAQNAGQNGHHYFFIYGVERVGALLGLRIIGGVDWYWEGAKYLVENQKDDGSWASQDADVDTLLSLLFLKRATMPQSGRKQAALLDRYKTVDAEAEVILNATGDTPQTIWIGKFPKAVSDRLEWPAEKGQGPHIAKVEYFARRQGEGTEQISIGVSTGDGTRPSGTERFAVQHTFSVNDNWLISAHVHALQPPATEGVTPEETVLKSPELSVRIDQVLDEALLDYAGDDIQNLSVVMTATASSEQGGQKAANAVDKKFNSRWHCTPADQTPKLSVELKRPVKIKSVVLTHAWARSTHLNAPRAHEIELVFNGKLVVSATMDPDAMHKTVVDLPKATRVKRFEIHIKSSLDRTVGTDGVGFAEIEVR